MAGPPLPATSSAVPTTSEEVVAKLTDITDPGDGSLTGRRVELTEVRVQSVTGDVTFWVGSDEERVLVVINEELQPERAVTVRPGQLLRISGSMERPPPEDIELSSGDRNALKGQSLYIRAELVEIVSE